jgi:hypothetical protein
LHLFGEAGGGDERGEVAAQAVVCVVVEPLDCGVIESGFPGLAGGPGRGGR